MIFDAASIAERMPTRPADPRAYLLAFYPEAPIPPLDHVVRTARPMTAYVNHGIWKARCECGARGVPAPGLVVWLDQPVGFCVRCLNRGHGGGWRPVRIPSADLRNRIEVVLLCRPEFGDRNWTPDESIAELIRQNIEAGDPVPEAA